ncbi:MAG: SUF system Fe-S cluster assembly protein [Bacteroidales bacterium]|nr:SUF system Fe-S cluster assembly protein [Bacteroidales bacterium]
MAEVKNFLQIETEIVQVLKNIFDPEIPVNIYDLGLIYAIDVDDSNKVEITMTLTAPNCPVADSLLEEVREKVRGIDGVTDAKVNLTFDPPWDESNLSDEAKLDLGLM